ncbi:MAG: ATP-binding cassette domain-containing protein [Candidatus Brockarchaeota archaeon]|nr:ATP-binding cassette domain-containing protein [Candidatus Brockarchaeota archaeon]
MDGFSLEVRDGEIMGFLGPNGAGKTTAMMVMATVYRPTSGTVEVEGYDVTAMPQKVRGFLGICFQDPKFDNRLSVQSVLEWHAKITGVPRDLRTKRIEDVLKRIGMWEDRSRRCFTLSGGMSKKVENAKVFIQRPKVAVFDEPTAFLDVPSRLTIWDMIRELRDGGSTVILATNMMDEADRLSDRVAIMDRGKLVKVGTPGELKQSIRGGEVLVVRSKMPGERVIEEIRQIPEVVEASYLEGAGVRIYLNQAGRVVQQVLAIFQKNGIGVENVTISQPTLEDVFLRYTGRGLDGK